MRLLLCLCVLGFAKNIVGKSLPSVFNDYVCHRSDPNIDECILNNLQRALPILASGIPEADIQPADPIHLDYMTVEGELEQFKIKMIMKNLTFEGHSKLQIQKVKFDPTSLQGEIQFVAPFMRFTTEYYATGRLFVIPLESTAFYEGNFTNYAINMKFRLKVVERKGIEYFSLDKMAVKMSLDKAHSKITSKYPGQQPAVNLIQDFLNENMDLILELIRPLFDSHSTKFYSYLIERALRLFPAEELLPN